MIRQNQSQRQKNDVDWLTIVLYIFLVLWGWLNIYAAVYDPEIEKSLFDFSINSGKQLAWIGTAVFLIFIIMLIDHRFFETFAFVIYFSLIGVLTLVLFFGKEIAGSKSWLVLGSVHIQPSEFAKMATSLALTSFLSQAQIKLDRWQTLLQAGIILALPACMILLQNDTGSTLVFSAFLLVLYREGINPAWIWFGFGTVILFVLALLVETQILVIGIGIFALLLLVWILFTNRLRAKLKATMVLFLFTILANAIVYSVDYFINHILQPHQQNRIKALINPDADPLGYGWNVTQSKIAIGSGGFLGKGFLEGTQTKFDFVPEQHTDFIFCTIGEEWGWLGSLVLIATFCGLFIRLIYLAERQRSKFARIYGYCVVAIMLFHFSINIGMTIGLFPVIGIPLPFFSYGGSSLWSFTILLFIFINMDAQRKNVLS